MDAADRGVPVRRALVVACAVLATGCYSFSTLGRARTVSEGRVEVWGAPEALVVATDSGASIRPLGELGVRYGATRDVELDARVTTLGLTLGPRIQLLRAPDPTNGLDILIAPALAYTAQDKLALEVPVLFGIDLGEHQIVIAPRLVYQMRLGVPSVGAVNFLYAGGSIGVAIQLDSHVALMPEVAFLGQIYSDPGFTSNVSSALGVQGSIGLLVDP
jgi:hypothetical protein